MADDPDLVAAQFVPALAWKPNGEPVNFSTLGVQLQMVNGVEKEMLVYPKSVRPAGVQPWAK